ncbi:MAG TPA: chromate efflux transporter [Candidatus Methylomirabilis sp.]|jgi:chromate transporter
MSAIMPLAELARLFLKLGATAFGGPAAHLAMMEDEVVRRRGWLTRESFLDLVGAVNLIPGPNSTEMAIHIGMTRARLPGLAVAGACFILPATVITLAFAWAYVRFGALPQAGALLYGVKPAVLAVVLSGVWRLGLTAARKLVPAAVGLAVTVLSLLGLNEVLLILASGAVGLALAVWRHRGGGAPAALALWGLGPFGASGLAAAAAPALALAAPVTLTALGLFFLKIGSVLFGTGYVLVAFLERGLVHEFRWLTQPQLLDAIAIGQFTPGPVLSTATFIGYVLAGVPGALVATAAIFLPSFVFVALTNPWVPRLRRSPLAAGFLDSVNGGSVGLMLAVLIVLARGALVDLPAWAIGLAAAFAIFRFRVGAPWVIAGAALAGWAIRAAL